MVYLRVTGTLNMTGNRNLQDFTNYHIYFLDFRRSVQDLATVGDPLGLIIASY